MNTTLHPVGEATVTHANLAQRIASASKNVGALATDKRNQAQGYDYISADKILERCGDALANAGVLLLPAVTQEFMEEKTTDKGRIRYDATVHFNMLLSDGASEYRAPWVGRGSDFTVPDKATYKAITSGHKYFLMKLLNVGVGNEDGEHEVAEAAPSAQRRTTDAPAAYVADDAPLLVPVRKLGSNVPSDVKQALEWYAALFGTSPDPFKNVPDVMELAQFLRNQDHGDPMPVEPAVDDITGEKKRSSMYGYLAGAIDKCAGEKGAHNIVLSYLLGAPVTKGTPPSLNHRWLIDDLKDETTRAWATIHDLYPELVLAYTSSRELA